MTPRDVVRSHRVALIRALGCHSPGCAERDTEVRAELLREYVDACRVVRVRVRVPRSMRGRRATA